MICARIETLVRSWTSDNGDPPDTDYQRGYMAACEEHARELTQLLAEEEGGWRPPPLAGICAYDLDECTITLALSSEAEVREANRMLPDRHRVRVMENDDALAP